MKINEIKELKIRTQNQINNLLYNYERETRLSIDKVIVQISDGGIASNSRLIKTIITSTI